MSPLERPQREPRAGSQQYVVVGRVGRAHGIRGEVAVQPRTDEPRRRFVAGAVLRAEGRELRVSGVREHQGRLLVAFDSVPDRTAAEAVAGVLLEARVDATERPEDPEEFYDHQLVGLWVQTVEGVDVGEVVRVDHYGGQDLLVIATPAGEVLFPFVRALVPEVDPAAGRLVLDDRPGLLQPEQWES